MRQTSLPSTADDLTFDEVHAFEELEFQLRNLAGQCEDALAVCSRLPRHGPVQRLRSVLAGLAADLSAPEPGTLWEELGGLVVRAGSEHARMDREIPF